MKCKSLEILEKNQYNLKQILLRKTPIVAIIVSDLARMEGEIKGMKKGIKALEEHIKRLEK